MTCLETEIAKAGYVRSPNNIERLPSIHTAGLLAGESPIWYAGATGVPSPKRGQFVQVDHDRLRVFETRLMGEAYSKRSWLDTVTIAVFETVEEFIAWCNACGSPAEANGPNLFD